MTGAPCPGCTALFLPGLSEDDALELWRAFGVSGGRETLLPLFARFERHPLLIQVLASQVAGYRPAPGDFEQWRRDHPGFSPADLPLVQVRSHVLAYALTGLDGKALQVLRTIAAFRMPARYDTLAALLANGPLPSPTPVATEDGGGGGKRFSDERELDAALTELEDRGLVGWDKRANRYDLHPIVRGVVWSGMPDDTRTGVFTSLQTHFGSVPQIDEDKVNSLEDLTPAIELYNTLIGLGQYDDAYAVFRDRLEYATLHLLSASRQHAELLEMLFSGDSHFPLLSEVEDQGTVLNSLALSYVLSGRPGQAVSLFEDSSFLFEQLSDWTGTSTTLGNLADALRLSGMLHKSEWIARKALVIDHSNADRIWRGNQSKMAGVGARELEDY